jgi:hypothetical protein
MSGWNNTGNAQLFRPSPARAAHHGLATPNFNPGDS